MSGIEPVLRKELHEAFIEGYLLAIEHAQQLLAIGQSGEDALKLMRTTASVGAANVAIKRAERSKP